ncbi:RNA polymerase sigma factor [Mycobacterium sp. 21AC1]|uniref:RNA polymerase sigma factor n=1 Tax=[Mycobacterium] appelbergii TaxID=2939269 RepID=UPI0029393E99|nr:RNA polymerase sigma factor [Mycobacterium sp. 21AC1]MDV3128064.1 RNA polymerase sigma factor [Mycobacterium sp. 21AC1]
MKAPFESIVDKHGATVLRMCTFVVGPSDAEDAWSETFLAALRAYPQLPEDANIQAWLVTIAHRKSVDIIRARQRDAVAVSAVPDRPSSIGVPGPADDDLSDAVRALPPKQRQAIAYHYLVGLPYTEVAAIVGGTTAAVRKAASDGIATLRTTYPDALLKEAHR